MLCEKTLYGANTINSIIKRREVNKYNVTLVYGKFSQEIHDISYLKKDDKTNKVDVIKIAQTGYEKTETIFYPLSYFEKLDISLISVKLITGKTHQIRSTLYSLGYPIVGEKKYSDVKSKYIEERHHINYQILHAYKLVFGDIPGYENLSNRIIEINYPEIVNVLKEQ